MSGDIQNMVILASSFLALFAVAELLYHKLHWRVEITRKIVHIGTGLLTLLFPVMLGNHWLVLLLCASFAIILIFSLRYKLLPSINAIDRESVGSLAYPLSVYICYLAFDYKQHNYMFFYLPVLLLAICDPVAALFGKRWPWGKYKVGNGYKTLIGSIAFVVTALLVFAGIWIFLNPAPWKMHTTLLAITTAIVSCCAEAFSGKGYDNISIPLSVLLTLFAFDSI